MNRILTFCIMMFITQSGTKYNALYPDSQFVSDSNDPKNRVNSNFRAVSKDYKSQNIYLDFPYRISSDSLRKRIPITYKIINESNKTILAGEKYTLFKKSNAARYIEVTLNGFFVDVGYKVQPKSQCIIEMETFLIKNLPPGKYKISKIIKVLPEKKEIFLTSEFEVL